jgi:hypothetical protein
MDPAHRAVVLILDLEEARVRVLNGARILAVLEGLVRDRLQAPVEPAMAPDSIATDNPQMNRRRSQTHGQSLARRRGKRRVKRLGSVKRRGDATRNRRSDKRKIGK